MSELAQLRYDINTLLILFSGCLTFLMLLGLTLFQAGMVRSKNVTSILAKNLCGFAAVCLGFLFVGHHIIYGNAQEVSYFYSVLEQLLPPSRSTPLIDSNYDGFAAVYFHLLLPCIAISIIIGITAERLKLWTFILFALALSMFIYPIQASWLWNNGFLKTHGFLDVSGAGIVYLCAAVSGFVATKLLGPRKAKYDSATTSKIFHASSIPLVITGLFFIYLGALGFGSGVHFIDSRAITASQMAHIFINTTSTFICALLSTLLITRIFYGKTDITLVSNGAIGGLAAIAASPLSPSIHTTFLIGVLASIIVLVLIALMERLRIDDPMGLFASFGGGSALGLIAASFTQNYSKLSELKGINWAWMSQFTSQLLGMGTIILWSGICSFVVWFTLDYIFAIRIAPEDENRGLDIFDYGMPAYPEFTKVRQ